MSTYPPPLLPVSNDPYSTDYSYKKEDHHQHSSEFFFRYHGSVIPRVFVPTMIMSIWATVVVVLFNYTSIFKGWLTNSPILITLLGVVLGLLLVFRTNTAYDRYWEGRKLWSNVETQIRNLARVIWVGVHAPGAAKLSPLEYGEKLGAMNLLMAYVTGTKHYLRNESGFLYKDLGPYLQHLPEYAKAEITPELEERIIPIDVTHHLAAYVAICREKGHIDASVQTYMNNCIGSLVDTFTQFTRVKMSPIPIAYAVHLRQILILYILSVPFQTVVLMNWATIPVVFISSFMLLGIEAIGGEIENPFGLDINDLDMDIFCENLHQELKSLTTRSTKLNPDSWLRPYSLNNQLPEAVYAAKHEHRRSETPASQLTLAAEHVELEVKK
ncbi:hypothetical protein HK098_008323 [Nowakowskiella sp. JEL0407]|nr:hypothetical protein HK098_008323 [Nowakowskiella sp. JEL0407]